jgi:hypothetical protein
MATTTTTKRKASSTKKTATNAKAKKPAVKKTIKAAAPKKTTSKKVVAKKEAASKTTLVKTIKKVGTKVSKFSKATRARIVSDTFSQLNMWNWVMAFLHAAQGVAVVILSRSDSLFSVSTTFVTQDKLASTDAAPVLVQAQRNLFDVNLAYIVAAFFFMSAIAHVVIASVYRKNYEKDLKIGINKVRWFEYGISASTMMVAIAMIVGVSDLSTFVLIFVATLVMNLLGLVMEVHNQTTQKTNWLSYIVGTIAGLAPWFVIGMYLFGTNQYGEGTIPTFVYFIFVSIFIFFSSFAVNMYLQYKGTGKWKDYLYGERAYMILSLVAKAALAWQVFAGTLRP